MQGENALKPIKWRIEKRQVNELRPHPENPRIITEEAIREVENSLNDSGDAGVIVITKENIILGGHVRWMAYMNDNPEKQIDVKVASRDLTDEESQKIMARLNRNAGQWDYAILANWDSSVLLDSGFTDKELGLDFEEQPTFIDRKPARASENTLNIELNDEQADVVQEALMKISRDRISIDENSRSIEASSIASLARFYLSHGNGA